MSSGIGRLSESDSEKLGQTETLVVAQTTLHDDQEIDVALRAAECPGGQGAVEIHACQLAVQNLSEAAHSGLDVVSYVSFQNDLPAKLRRSLLPFA